MKNPWVRCVAAVFAALGVLIVLKVVGLAPDDVFIPPRDGRHLRTPFGELHIEGGDRPGIFNSLLLMHILSVPAAWHLCRRAGYSSWFSLAMLIPLANVLLLYFLAFAEWPTQTRDDRPANSGTAPPEEKALSTRASDDIRA